ncbi:MAG TPA: iron-containing redox enzyme family protein [Polyangiaceae bacterium]|nr:iron-containing redox enzyme family protein [Polyangiaceae bacterium]
MGQPLIERLAVLRAESLSRMRRTPLVRALLGGDLPRRAYARYLLDVHHYAQHSASVIAMAGARSVAGHPEVAGYLIRHAAEELGHEVWAREDLTALGLSADEIDLARPSAGCMCMIGLEYFWAAHGNPVALLGWTFALEALGDDLGHLAASAIVGLATEGGRMTRFLRGHGQADHEHIQDIVAVIERHVSRPVDQEDLFYVASRSAELYAQIVEDAGRQPS